MRPIAEMDRCWRQIKSKDKIAARELKTKLDAHHAEEKQTLERKQASDKLIDSMQTLAGSVWSPHYANTHARLYERWTALDFKPDDESTKRFEQAEKTARAKVDENAATQQLHDDRENLLTRLRDAHDALSVCAAGDVAAAIQSTATCLTESDAQWRQLGQAPDSETQQFRQQHQALSKLQKLAQTIDRVGNPPADQPPDWSAQLKSLEQIQRQLGDSKPP